MSEPIRIILPTIFPMKTVNAWLIRDPEPTLIDCGENTKANWEAMQNHLKEAGLQIADIKKVIITHAHVDHMGMAGLIAEKSDAEIWVNELTYPWALDVRKMWVKREEILLGMIRDNMAGNAKGKEFLEVLPKFMGLALDYWVDIPEEKLKIFPKEGDIEIGGETWKSIYVPGHSVTQSMIYNPMNHHLISADVLLKITPSPVIEAEPDDPSKRIPSLKQLLESFNKCLQLEISKVFPGHYEVFENPRQLIEKQVFRIHQRKEQCFHLIESGTHSMHDLFVTMYKDYRNMPGLSMLVGYLDLLSEEGKIRSEMQNGERLFFIKQ